MFYYLNGELVYVEPNLAVIDCGGVGYKCSITANTRRKLGKLGEKTRLFTYMHVREDAIELFGFADAEEMNCFKMLLSVSGVGLKLALAILSEVTPEKFALAVVTNDLKTLTRIPGIGTKLAQRILLELKDKIKNEQLAQTDKGGEDLAADLDGQGSIAEAVRALSVLGYSRSQAEQAVRQFDANGMTVEQIIKQALKMLMKNI